MTKYVSKDNFQSYHTELKKYIDNILENTLDLLTYGVSWNPNNSDPHLTRVGNMTYHKSLPIQNGMKGCIAQPKNNGKIMYYLNHNDWRFKEIPDYLRDKAITSNTITDDVFKDLKYELQYVKINDTVYQIKSINTETKTATLDNTIEDDTYTIELGSCTNGYDGEVMVEVPEFWIRSWDSDTKQEVRISPVYIDGTWEHQKHTLIGAYRATVLNTVPTNMGYLSTLVTNSAISVVNVHDYCRGGGNRTDYDQYLSTDIFRTDLGKPITVISISSMRKYAKNAGQQLLDYYQYKNIFYWLWVIEYANFNSQENYTSELTEEGYHKGGMGIGITTYNNAYYNYQKPLTPCGYGNSLGNGTGLVSLTIPEFTYNSNKVQEAQTMQMPRWRGFDNPFGDIMTILDGIFMSTESSHPVYACKDTINYADTNKYSKIGNLIDSKENYGFIKKLDLKEDAQLLVKELGATQTTGLCDYYQSYDRNYYSIKFQVGGTYYDYRNAGIWEIYLCDAFDSDNYISSFRTSYVLN